MPEQNFQKGDRVVSGDVRAVVVKVRGKKIYLISETGYRFESTVDLWRKDRGQKFVDRL